MKYAIIESGGKQYKASEGKILEVEKIDLKKGQAYKFEKVLLYTIDGKCKIGRPLVSGVSVSGRVIGQIKGDKIRVAKFKAKSRYRKVKGHRQSLTRIQIDKIMPVESSVKQEKKSGSKEETQNQKIKAA